MTILRVIVLASVVVGMQARLSAVVEGFGASSMPSAPSASGPVQSGDLQAQQVVAFMRVVPLLAAAVAAVYPEVEENDATLRCVLQVGQEARALADWLEHWHRQGLIEEAHYPHLLKHVGALADRRVHAVPFGVSLVMSELATASARDESVHTAPAHERVLEAMADAHLQLQLEIVLDPVAAQPAGPSQQAMGQARRVPLPVAVQPAPAAPSSCWRVCCRETCAGWEEALNACCTDSCCNYWSTEKSCCFKCSATCSYVALTVGSIVVAIVAICVEVGRSRRHHHHHCHH